jgi:hypothetical protein
MYGAVFGQFSMGAVLSVTVTYGAVFGLLSNLHGRRARYRRPSHARFEVGEVNFATGPPVWSIRFARVII